MQTYLLGAAPGLQWKASKLSPLYNFFTRPFVMAVPLEQVTVEASGHLRSLRSKLHQEEEQVEQARRKVAEVSRCIDQTHRQFRHDVIWSAGTKAENRGWSLDDVIPIHCFMFGLQTFLRQSSQLHTVQFRWYSRDPREYLRQFIYAEFIAPIVSGAKTLLRLVKMPWRVFTFIRDTAPSRRKRFAEWNQWLFSSRVTGSVQLALIVTVAGLLVFIPSLQSIFPFGLWAPLAVVLSVERGARQGSTLKATGFRVYGTTIGSIIGYLIALIAAGSPYVIAALLAGWVFVAGYSRSSKTWGGLGLIITISAPLIVFRGSGPLATTLGLQQLALYRIQATLIGQLVAMGISIVWPVRAAVLLRNRSTARTLLALRGCFDHMMKGFIERDYCVPLFHIKRMELDMKKAWEMQSVLIQEARDEPRLWRPTFPFDIFDRIITSSRSLSQHITLMDRALYWGWKEGSQLAQYLIQPLHEHLEQIHSQVVMMLDELVRRIRHFDARMSHFSTTLGIHLSAGPAGAGAGAGEEVPAASSSSTPLRMSLTVQHLEQEMKKTLNRLIGKQFKKLDVLPISNYDVLTFQTVLFALRLLVGEIRNLWEAVLHLLQVEALHQRK